MPIPQEHLHSGLGLGRLLFADTSGLILSSNSALIHLEFEALHPFMDGNGRLGRMIIPLFPYAARDYL